MHVRECKDVALLRTKPTTADFDLQVFDGLDGRAGRWQWVIYRTDTSERLAFGEVAGIEVVAKEVCSQIHMRTDLGGGTVE